jgi:hypothetical protein
MNRTGARLDDFIMKITGRVRIAAIPIRKTVALAAPIELINPTATALPI